ncbi:MAG TPA: iron ABC transporter permease [Acetobacteraceae bacterium]|nr:iron ABC transporter permease [Acetobacteraceae bacterium]
MNRRRWNGRRLPGAEPCLAVAIAVVVAWLSLLPLARLGAAALHPASLSAVFQSAAVFRALLRSGLTSLGGAAVALVLGTLYATATTLTDAGARRLLSAAALQPLLIPGQIIALAWMQMPVWFRGSESAIYTGWGIAALLGLEHIPIVFLAARAAMAGIPADLIEAARADGARAPRVLFRIALPLATPGLIAGFGLAVVACLGSFGIPAMIGIPARYPTLAVLIYQRLTGFGATMLPEAAAMALCLAVISIGAALAVAWAGRRVDARTIGAASGGTHRIELGRWRIPVTVALLGLSVVTMVLPLASLIATSLSRAYGVPLHPATATLAHYVTVLRTAQTQRAFTTSAWLSAGAAAIIIALALPAAVLGSWSDRAWLRRLIRLIDPLIDSPYALPGIVLAIGMILLYLRPLPLLHVSLYGTPWIMLLAYVPRFLPLGLRPVQAALARIDPVMDEAARAQGARFLHRMAGITIPLLGPAAVGAGILVLLTAFGELTVSALLWSPGHETIGVLIFSLNEGGNIAEAAAVSVLCLALVFMLAGLTVLLPATARRVLPWSA